MRMNCENAFFQSRVLLLFVLLCLSSCKQAILHKLDELEANRVLVALADAGVDADKKQEGNQWNIVVESTLSTKALKVLEDSRVLRRDLIHAQSSQSGLIQTREEREHFLERQLSWGLEQTLETVVGVLEARVHLYKSPTDEFRPKVNKQDSASVLIIAAMNAEISEEQIRYIVAGASGIGTPSITVVVSRRHGDAHQKVVSSGQSSDLNQLNAQESVSRQPNNGSNTWYSRVFLRKNVSNMLFALCGVGGAIGCLVLLRWRKHRNNLNNRNHKDENKLRANGIDNREINDFTINKKHVAENNIVGGNNGQAHFFETNQAACEVFPI